MNERDAAAAEDVRGAPVDDQRASWGQVLRSPIAWGLVVGVAQALTPVGFWWLPANTVYAIGLVLIAAVYIGFAVADGRGHVLAVETTVVTGFVVLAAAAVTGSPWLLVAGFVAHGVKDFWQLRTGFVTNTRWWPPFCAAVDFLVALLLAIVLTLGNGFS